MTGDRREGLRVPPPLGVGVALVCDAQTIVRHVIRDDVGLPSRAEPRRSFAALVDPESGDKARRFLGAITTHGVAFDWGMTIPTDAGAARLRFAGTTTSTGLLIVAAPSVVALGAFCRELLDSGDDAVRGIRADLRALVMQAESASTADRDAHDECRRLREELAAARRELERCAERESARDGDRVTAETLEQALLRLELPRHPRVRLSAVRACGTRRPAESLAWCDAFRLPDDRLALVAARVGGGGVRGLVMTAEVRAAIRTLASEGQSPFAVLSRLDRVLRLSCSAPLPATVVLAVLDPAAMAVTYSIAGHPAPLLVTSAGASAPLGGAGWPLGVRVGALRPSRTVRLQDGSLLVLYAGPPASEGGADVLEDVAAAARAASAEGSRDPAPGICRRLPGGARPAEDVAVLAVAIEPPA